MTKEFFHHLYFILIILNIIVIPQRGISQSTLPKGFVYLETIPFDLKYHSEDNFTGKCIYGYEDEKLIITKAAQDALLKIQAQLLKKGLSLYIFDAYRPQKAVDHFVRWSKDWRDTLRKQTFYPNIHKKNLFNLGYIASHSRHSSGSTLDITIIRKDGTFLDMGSPYDFFGPISHYNTEKITKQQSKNRQLLYTVMTKNGFRSYAMEWWHFTLINEPFRNKYFNFDIL